MKHLFKLVPLDAEWILAEDNSLFKIVTLVLNLGSWSRLKGVADYFVPFRISHCLYNIII